MSISTVLEEGWPQDKQVKALAQKSGHLFIFAKTALRFIGDDHVLNPQRQMDILLGLGVDKPTASTYYLLDVMYNQVLESALSGARDSDDICRRFRRVVGCIILSQDALPVSAIAIITGYSLGEVLATLRRTQSVIHLSSPPGTVAQRAPDLLPRIYHPPFSNYLVDPGRCVDSRFTIVHTETHDFIVLRCFQLMKAFLRRNILNLPEPTIDNISIPDLQAKVQSAITFEGAYACRFWIIHFLKSKKGKEILDALREFLSHWFLSWCEALSLLDSAHSGNARGLQLGAVASGLQIAWQLSVSILR